MLKLDVSGTEVSGDLYRGMHKEPLAGSWQGPPLEQNAERAFEARRWQKAAEAYTKLAVDQPDNGGVHYRLGFSLLASNGGDSRAARAFQRAADLDFQKSTCLYNTACALARNKELDGALDALRKSLDAGFSQTELLRSDSDLDNLRGDTRFASLVKQHTNH